MDSDKIKIYSIFIVVMILVVALLPLSGDLLEVPPESASTLDRGSYNTMRNTASRFKASELSALLGGMVMSDYKYEPLKVKEFENLKGIDHPFGQ